jgi:hypothetical protein
MTAFNTTRTLRRVFNGTAYLDRAAPRFAPAKFLVLAFTRGPFIELAPGSNCPGRISWPGRSALASRFLAFCGAFAFARWRDLALVMSSSPFQVALSNFDDPLRQSVKPFCEYLSVGLTVLPPPEISPKIRKKSLSGDKTKVVSPVPKAFRYACLEQ